MSLPGYATRRNAITVLTSLVVLVVVFWLGDAMHGRFWNPLTPNSTSHLNFSSLNDLYTLLQNDYDGGLDQQKLLDGAREGLVSAAGDPYTVYLTAKDATSLNDQLSGKLSGIGAQIGIKNSVLTVIAPIADSPAAKAGLRAGDIVAQINGEDTSGLSVDTAVSKIRGQAGTQVKLKLIRGVNTPAFDVTITRADLTVPSVNWSLKNGNIGYIQITQFGTDTANLVDKAAGDLKSQGATKIILDLRNNGGGYLDAGVAVASEFLPSGKTVVSERTGGKTTSTQTAAAGGQLIGLPTIVLVNDGSASASEIVSGALHDNGAARLVGEKTFGKGSVQEIKNLPGGAELKVTVAHWYTPKGININKAGISPDVTVDLTTDDYNNSRDPQLDKALQLLQ